MLIAKYVDDHLVYGNHWDFFPQTQFGKNGPTDEWLTAHNCYRVYFEKDHDPSSQTLISSDPYMENGKVYIVTVQEKDENDLNIDRLNLEAEVRRKRNSLLSETDWRFRSDLTPSQAWIDYCKALRDIPQQPDFPYNISWPTEPNE